MMSYDDLWLMMIYADSWVMNINDDFCWLMNNDGLCWFMINVDLWWLMINDDLCWSMINDDLCWLMLVIDDFWWFMIIYDDLLLTFFRCFWVATVNWCVWRHVSYEVWVTWGMRILEKLRLTLLSQTAFPDWNDLSTPLPNPHNISQTYQTRIIQRRIPDRQCFHDWFTARHGLWSLNPQSSARLRSEFELILRVARLFKVSLLPRKFGDEPTGSILLHSLAALETSSTGDMTQQGVVIMIITSIVIICHREKFTFFGLELWNMITQPWIGNPYVCHFNSISSWWYGHPQKHKKLWPWNPFDHGTYMQIISKTMHITNLVST